jgi:hypothetical protein
VSVVRVRVTLRLTVSQSFRLGFEPRLGLMTRYLFPHESCCPVYMGRPLWREDGSVFCQGQSIICHLSVYTYYLQHDIYQLIYVQYVQGLCQSKLGTADYALLIVATATTAVSHLNGPPNLPTWRAGPRIYIPQWQGGPVIPPGTGFAFRRLLRLAELRCRYSRTPSSFIIHHVSVSDGYEHRSLKEEVLKRTNRLLSFDTIRTA